MSLDKAVANLKFDTRMVEFNLRTGQLTQEDLKKHLASLPDNAANAEKMDIEENETQDSDQH